MRLDQAGHQRAASPVDDAVSGQIDGGRGGQHRLDAVLLDDHAAGERRAARPVEDVRVADDGPHLGLSRGPVRYPVRQPMRQKKRQV